MNKEILIVHDGISYASDHVLQMTSKARMLADSKNACSKESDYNLQVTVLCIGPEKKEDYEILLEYGADRVLTCFTEEKITTNLFCNIIFQVVKKENIMAVFYPASGFGKQVAAVLSTRFEAGLTADCIDIFFDEQSQMCFSRAAMNDSIIARIKCINNPLMMCTVKKNVFTKQRQDRAGSISIFSYEMEEDDKDPVEVIESYPIENDSQETVNLDQYSTVFGVGRGVKDKKTYQRICTVAKKCGAVVVGTRAVVEEGLVTKDYQVGQSGKSISPKIYVCFGVSGACQHIVGIKNAELIIAVNNDKDAAIFQYADYKVIEDLNLILGEMERLLKIV